MIPKIRYLIFRYICIHWNMFWKTWKLYADTDRTCRRSWVNMYRSNASLLMQVCEVWLMSKAYSRKSPEKSESGYFISFWNMWFHLFVCLFGFFFSSLSWAFKFLSIFNHAATNAFRFWNKVLDLVLCLEYNIWCLKRNCNKKKGITEQGICHICRKLKSNCLMVHRIWWGDASALLLVMTGIILYVAKLSSDDRIFPHFFKHSEYAPFL